jgi:hypothetical protein
MNVALFINSSSTPYRYLIFSIIAPKLLLCGLRHEPPILDGDGDIVSNLKFASAFERFPYFRGLVGSPFKSSAVT